jgi:acetyl-CoA C-acetyltransferase
MPAPLVKIDLELRYTRRVGPVIGASGMTRFPEAALPVQGKAGDHQIERAQIERAQIECAQVGLAHAYGAMAQYFALAVLSASPSPSPW